MRASPVSSITSYHRPADRIPQLQHGGLHVKLGLDPRQARRLQRGTRSQHFHDGAGAGLVAAFGGTQRFGGRGFAGPRRVDARHRVLKRDPCGQRVDLGGLQGQGLLRLGVSQVGAGGCHGSSRQTAVEQAVGDGCPNGPDHSVGCRGILPDIVCRRRGYRQQWTCASACATAAWRVATTACARRTEKYACAAVSAALWRAWASEASADDTAASACLIWYRAWRLSSSSDADTLTLLLVAVGTTVVVSEEFP